MRSNRSAEPERVAWLDPGSWSRITEPRKGCSFEAADILLARSMMLSAAQRLLQLTPSTSPLHADLHGLPLMLIQIGSAL